MKSCLRQHLEKRSCNLGEIFSPVKEELTKVREIINDGIQTENSSLSKMGRYLFSSKGKLIRPALVLLASKVTGCNDTDRAIRIAGSIELIHTATLVHDDIIDKAECRRDRKTINNKFGENNAILLGDYLYSASFRLISSLGDTSLFRYLVGVTREICEGETAQLSMAFRYVSEKKYLEIIGKKTASLFEASCRLGADGSKSGEALISYGYNLGMAFQIIDDCIDRSGDIHDGKYTLPMIYGEIDKAIKKGRDFIDKACSALDKFRDSIFKDSLLDLAYYVGQRI